MVYEASVESFEISKDKKKPTTKFVGKFRVKIEPIGVRIAHIRVAQNLEGRVFIEMPATPTPGGWEKNISLPPQIHNAVRSAIMGELREAGLVSEPAPEREPARFDPDAEPESEIGLPSSLIAQ